ncbi:MAG: sodium-dependent transporter [Candidatus Gastranaerophilales bacterium]|nr:sodium-dependent transporter [Candidatus Gastranaerophilales bacterium]
MENRPSWSSQFAFIISTIGSAIGLGNIWRFPYIMGKNGGAIFLIIYLILILFICSIPLLAELILGKISQKNTLGAYCSINPKFEAFGWLNVISTIMISSFYFVVGGWVIYYILKSFTLNQITDFGQYFTNFVSGTYTPILFTLFFLFICIFFIYRGVNQGIETANKIMMPALGVLLIVLVAVSLNLPNAHLGLKFMFSPDFSEIDFSMLLAALGQALFTLSIGMGTILTYGSYLKKEDNIAKSAFTIIVADTIFAILAGVMIFPAVFSFGLQPDSGASLVFITLPKIFAQMQYGGLVALGFFFLLFFAALTSGISIVEVPVAVMIEKFNISRKKAAAIMFAIIGLLSVPVTLSFSALKDFKILGKTLFDLFDFTTANILMPVSSMIVCLVVGWCLNLANDYVFKSKTLHNIFIFMMKYILPILFIILIITGLMG